MNKSSKRNFFLLQKKTSVPDNDLPPTCAIHPPPCNYLPRRLPNMNYIERFPCTLLPTGFFPAEDSGRKWEMVREAASSPWWGRQTQWHNNPATTSSEYSQYLQLCRSSLRNKLPLMNGCTIYFLLWPWLIYQDKVKMLMAPLTFLYLKYFLNFLFMQSFFTLTFKMPGCLPGAIFKFFPKLANLFSRLSQVGETSWNSTKVNLKETDVDLLCFVTWLMTKL